MVNRFINLTGGSAIPTKRGGGRNRRRRSQRRRDETTGGKQRTGIIVGVVVAAVAAIAIAVVLLNVGSDEHDSQGPIAALAISPEDATTGIAVGNKVPDFEIRLNNGDIVSASNQVEDRKPTFYFFFATW